MLHRAMVEHHVPAGSNVITQGEKGNHFYVVGAGELDAFVTSSGAATATRADPERQQFVKTFAAGDMFGELALMYNCPRTASIQARTDVTLWSLDRVSFRLIVLEANTRKTAGLETIIEKVPLSTPRSKAQPLPSPLALALTPNLSP
jgi:cAMP-dependent protein kinase regulator